MIRSDLADMEYRLAIGKSLTIQEQSAILEDLLTIRDAVLLELVDLRAINRRLKDSEITCAIHSIRRALDRQ